MIILIIRIIVSYDQNISLIIHVKDGSHGMIRHPFCVYITAHYITTAVQKMLTPEITFLALNPWYIQSTCVHRTVTKNIKNHTVLCKIQNTGHCTFISYTLQFYASYSSSRPTLILGTERRVGAGLPGSQPRIYFPANFRYRRTRSNHSRSIPFRKL